MRPRSTGLAQHGGPPNWLEKSDPAGGVVLYLIGRSIPPALTDHTSCPDLGMIYYWMYTNYRHELRLPRKAWLLSGPNSQLHIWAKGWSWSECFWVMQPNFRPLGNLRNVSATFWRKFHRVRKISSDWLGGGGDARPIATITYKVVLRRHTANTQYRKFVTNIPRKEIARPQSQFPHSCVCQQFIYYQDRSEKCLNHKICGPILGIYKSLTDTGN